MTTYQLRDYQRQASDAAVAFFRDKAKRHNAVMVLPTGAGKSLVIADIAARLDGHVLVFQPSKEILEQNYKKLCSYGVLDCSVYSASLNRKDVSRITFATIGSAANHPELFAHFRHVVIDECHLVNPKEGMYRDFLDALPCKVLGLTATPYRLSSSRNFGSMLKFITRTRPRVFGEVIYHVQVSTLLEMGYLAPLQYYHMPPTGWDRGNLALNTTGADYTDQSVRDEYRRVDLQGWLLQIIDRLLHNRVTGIKRRGILVFTRFVEEAENLVRQIPGAAIVSGSTPKREREEILEGFKAGRVPVVANVGVLTTGFDYPELDTIVMARPTMSLALWYQIVGRAIRPSPGKTAWIVDLCGNLQRFGRVEDLKLVDGGNGKWAVFSRGRQLTNVYFD